MRELFGVAQAGLIAFHPEPNHFYSIPNKIFEYMSAGLPVIASELPMQRSIVEETGCGILADAKSANSIFTKTPVPRRAGHPTGPNDRRQRRLWLVMRRPEK